MARYRRAFFKLVPAWLSDMDSDNGRVLYSLGVIMDAFVERARQGLYARFPTYAPPSALPYIGRDRKIVRGINEPDASYRERLIRWLDDHATRGNAFALLNQLGAYLQTPVRIRIVDQRGNWFTRESDGTFSYLLKQGNWNWDNATPDRWSRFWVIIYPTAGGAPWTAAGMWGDDDLWELGVWGTPGQTIGTTATPEQVASVRGIIREWKPAGTRCEWIIVAGDPSSFDPTVPNQPQPNPGEWGNWGRDDGAGNYVSARLNTARYWKGSVAA